VLSAPSGAGKTTLVRRLVELQPELRFSVSYTTRPRRRGESDGRDYFFVDEAEFERMREHGDFLEHASVFGHHYGTGREQVGRLLDAGHDVILEIDWQGARQVRTNLPGAHSIFILPPSLDELERRLRGRSTDTDAVIRRRLGQAIDDISHWQEFDYVIVNDDLERAVHELREILAGRGEATATDDPAHRQRVARIAAPPV
jgi:guanylate kinase